jgi:hypothetical protein
MLKVVYFLHKNAARCKEENNKRMLHFHVVKPFVPGEIRHS